MSKSVIFSSDPLSLKINYTSYYLIQRNNKISTSYKVHFGNMVEVSFLWNSGIFLVMKSNE